jgi:DNA polymerase III epsilon subunit-like protein
MKHGKRWVVIDTETDGLYEPIHIVELSAQLMEGWHPVGDAFTMLLNHDVPIPAEAVAIHGYTQAYLRKHGQDPVLVHAAFRAYAQAYPLVAHNLSYDWNRCLEPEWARLRIPRAGQRGFCCMMLARRLLSGIRSCRLENLKQRFGLTESRSHQALNDVLTVVELFQKVYRARLEPAGLDTFDSVAAFARRTPVANCLDIIRATPSKPQGVTSQDPPGTRHPAAPQNSRSDGSHGSIDPLSTPAVGY